MKDPTKIRQQFKRKRDNYVRKLKRNKQINDYLRMELRSCDTHGLPYIANNEIHWFERLFWTVSFVCTLSLMGSLILSQCVRYLRDPVVMSVEMDYFKWKINYPAITLCAKDNVDEEAFQTAANETLANTGVDLTNTFKVASLIGLHNVETIDFNDATVSQSLIDSRDLRGLSVILFKKFSNDCLTTSTNWPVTVDTVWTEVGMCHVINSNVAKYDDHTEFEDTDYKKTNIDLTVFDKDFFMQVLDYADEYKLYIHHPDDIILITTPYYEISSGYMMYAVKVWSTRVTDAVRHIPLSYRNCRFVNEPISERYPVYSYNHCLLECRLRMMLKLCKCIPHFYKYLSHENVCELKQLECIKHYKKEMIKLSTSKRTRNGFINNDDLPKSPRDCNCLSSCETDVYLKDVEISSPQDSNKNRVRVGISSFPKVRVVREIIFSLYDVILRSGGVMNLCMGTSIISLMELFILAIKIFGLTVIRVIRFLRLCKLKGKGNKKSK